MKPITGLFLGAGASYEVGMPLVWELTKEVTDWLTPAKLRDLNAGWYLQGSGIPDAVIDDFVDVLVRPDMHYEALLGYLETQFRRCNNQLGQGYYGLYSWLIEIVYHVLYIHHVKNLTFLDGSLPRFDGIRSLVDSSTPLWIFSLNHDVMIETIAARLSIPLYTGFSPTTVRLPRRDGDGRKIGELQAEVLTQADIKSGGMFYPNPPCPGIYLLKIHGALDIFTFNDGKDLLKLLPSGSGTYGYIDALRAANEELIYLLPGSPGGMAKATNEIAYADDDDVMQFLRRSLLSGANKFSERNTQVLPLEMLKYFRSNLNHVTRLVCIGYGLGDLHINAVIKEWLEFSSEREIELVNPINDSIPSFLLHLSPQVTLTKSDTTDFLDQRSGITRTFLEKLEKRVALSLRRRGKAGAEHAINTVTAKKQQKITELMAKKLAEIPRVNGKPDLSSLGEPTEIAKIWAREAQSSKEEFLKDLMDHLEETEDK